MTALEEAVKTLKCRRIMSVEWIIQGLPQSNSNMISYTQKHIVFHSLGILVHHAFLHSSFTSVASVHLWQKGTELQIVQKNTLIKSFNIFTQIYLPYLWHFATFTGSKPNWTFCKCLSFASLAICSWYKEGFVKYWEQSPSCNFKTIPKWGVSI